MSVPYLIFCDVDEVTAALMPEWLRLYNDEHGDSLTHKDVAGWNLHEYVRPECGRKVYDYLHVADLYDRVQPVPGALEGVTALRAAGHRVVFATAANVHQAGKKLLWLERHGFLTLRYGTNSTDYIEVQDKSLLRGDILIDDGIHNVKAFSESVGCGYHRSGEAILFGAPWNVSEQWDLRAADWSEVVRIILGGGL